MIVPDHPKTGVADDPKHQNKPATSSDGQYFEVPYIWNSIGERNGMGTIEDMIDAISRYRRDEGVTRHTEIGCRIIVNPVFFNPKDWIEPPSNWSKFTVSGKSYDLVGTEAQELLTALIERTPRANLEAVPEQAIGPNGPNVLNVTEN